MSELEGKGPLALPWPPLPKGRTRLPKKGTGSTQIIEGTKVFQNTVTYQSIVTYQTTVTYVTAPIFPTGVMAGHAIFGDGSDGDVIISVNTQLARDMYYDDLTVNAGITLNAYGYRIFVKGTLTNNGTITRLGAVAADINGKNGTNLAGGGYGSTPPLTSLGIGSNGGNGGLNVGGFGGSTVNPGIGGTGGTGGNGAAGDGAVGGVVTPPVSGHGGWRHVPIAINLATYTIAGAGTPLKGGSGGGGGGGQLVRVVVGAGRVMVVWLS